MTHFDQAFRSTSSSGTCTPAGRCSARPPAARPSACGGSRWRPEGGRRPRTSTAVGGDLLVLAGTGVFLAARADRGDPRRRLRSSTSPRRGAHTVHAVDGGIDLLAFGTRDYDESVRFPRLEMSLIGGRVGRRAPPARWTACRSSSCPKRRPGPPALPAQPGPRPPTIVNLDDCRARDRRASARSGGPGATSATPAGLAARAGSSTLTVAPGKVSAPLHCHSIEEEIFVDPRRRRRR